MTMLYATAYKPRLAPAFYQLLNRVVKQHLDTGRLMGVTTTDGEFVVMETTEARGLIEREVGTIQSLLTRPSQDFPYPANFITVEVLQGIHDAKVQLEAKRQERAANPPAPKPKEAKAGGARGKGPSNAAPPPTDPATEPPIAGQENEPAA